MSAPVECVLGIDPGLSGAVAVYFPANPRHIVAEDVPVVAGEIDAVTLSQRIRQMAPTRAVIERVGAMPKQGVSSTFKFGQAFGAVKAILQVLGIPYEMVAPSVWKHHYKLDADKERSRQRAMEMWPEATCFGRVKDHGRAEAALMAHYGATVGRLRSNP